MSTYGFLFRITCNGIFRVLECVDVRDEQLADVFIVLGGAAEVSTADAAPCSGVTSEPPYLGNEKLKNGGE